MSNFFTETQWKELELQTLIFNYFVSGIPVPFHLIALLRRSFFFLDPYSLHPSMNFGRKVEDPEPWRCKRTDGKKWRCSKEAFSDSKYCERHMHRGKKSSRKLVEHPTTPNTLATMNTTHLLLGSPSSMPSEKSYRYCNGVKEGAYECHNFFSEATREERERSLGLKQRSYYELEGEKKQEKHCYVLGTDLMLEKPVNNKVEREQGVEKPNPLLCLFRDCGEESKTQLSISIP